MKKIFYILLFMVLCGFIFLSFREKISEPHTLKLWYKQPAGSWTEALPVGNGRLGAMIFGKTGTEIIQLNEESLWAGTKLNNNNPEALSHLPEIRQLLLQEKNVEADALAKKYLLGTPPRIRSYQTLGDLILNFPNPSGIKNYRRELDLTTGIARTEYVQDGTIYTRSVFASVPDNVIVIRITAKKGKINGAVALKRMIDAETRASGNSLRMTGQINDTINPERGPAGKHMRFAAKAVINTKDGKVKPSGDSLVIQNASEVTILLTAKTDYNLQLLNSDEQIDPVKECNLILDKVKGKSYKEIENAHLKDYGNMFGRVDFRICNEEKDTIPTDRRLKSLTANKPDHHLEELYFQYGRYLLMSSSRYPGVLPANLQGIWNKEMSAPWNSDFHTNINLQMNYWLADVCNLPETFEPLTAFFNQLIVPGSQTAREMYGCNGWTLHHLTDPFGKTGIMDAVKSGTFPMGGPWMALHFWDHFQFSGDTAYLKENWPLLKGSAQFLMGFLIPDPNGYLVTAPSYSPENTFYLPGTKTRMQLTYGATMDIEIARELLAACIKANNIVGGSSSFADSMQTVMQKLPPLKTGKHGTIMEWIRDYDEVEPGHRHISHLFALHPGTQINESTPDLMNAARKTIERRLANGGGHTGWSRAWIINFYARLKDGENAYQHLQALFTKSTLINLFDTHPPFQIDGNFGGTAGIAEMLLQSHSGIVDILPALPASWSNGFIKGLKARGNYLVNIYWKAGRLDRVEIQPAYNGPCVVKYGNKETKLNGKAGKSYIFDKNLELLN